MKMMEDCPVKEMCSIYENAPEDCNESCEDYNLWLRNNKSGVIWYLKRLVEIVDILITIFVVIIEQIVHIVLGLMIVMFGLKRNKSGVIGNEVKEK